MEVILKRRSGEEIPLSIQPKDSILQIKQRFEEKEGVPTSIQLMVYEGRRLADDKAGEVYSLHEGSIINLYCYRDRCLKSIYF